MTSKIFSENEWIYESYKSHMLASECTKNCKACEYCQFISKLSINVLPEMVFPLNYLNIAYKERFKLKFNAINALQLIKKEVDTNLKVSYSKEWMQSKEESINELENMIKPYDWTFTTYYKGTLEGVNKSDIEKTDECIDLERLKKIDKILYFDEVDLYEDELGDNGVSLCNVKIRVMPEYFLILLRFFLRVDHVMIKSHETRYFHEFGQSYVLREYCQKEESLKNLENVPSQILLNPNEICQRLPITHQLNEKIKIHT